MAPNAIVILQMLEIKSGLELDADFVEIARGPRVRGVDGSSGHFLFGEFPELLDLVLERLRRETD